MRWIDTPSGEAAALLGGVILPFAFAPYHYPILAFLSLALLFWSWQGVARQRTLLRGYLFGLGLFGVGVSWVFISIHTFGGAGILVSSALTALLVAFLALFPAIAAGLSVFFLPDRPLLQLLLVYPAIWAGVEWIRGWFLTGFPWLQVGYSQMETPLAGLAPITGVYGLSWATALSAATLVSAVCYTRNWQRWALIAGLCLFWTGSHRLSSVEWTRPLGLPFQATLIQANIPQKLKFRPEQRRATLDLYARMTREHLDSRLIVWPETAVPGFYRTLPRRYFSALQADAQRTHTDLLFGILTFGDSQNRYYNTLMALGAVPGQYAKRHLVPFGEYLPLKPFSSFIANQLQIPMSDFSSGAANQMPLYAAGYLLAPSICYEDIFGQESRLGLPDAAYLVNITNDAWFGDSMAPHQHLQMASFRALETGRPMLRATNSGASAFINARGNITHTAPLFQRTTLTASITPMTGSTPYIRFGDRPVLALLGLSLGLAGICGYMPSKMTHTGRITVPEFKH